MRLTALTLANYGPFRAARIAFDPSPGALNLLIAPNGAGKSVLRGAFGDLLFNIPGQTGMGFRYGYKDMRLLAEAVGPDGAPFAFGRRKGQGNTLIDAEGAPLDPARLARLLGPADRTLLERLFALDTERLRSGGRDLLAADGAVADALLSAAGGLRHARQVRAALDAARDALAPGRKAQARPFYAALDRLTDAQKRLTGTVQRPEKREAQEKEFSHAEAEYEQARKTARNAAERLAQLQRIRRVAPMLRQHDDAQAWLAANEDAPVLPADARARLDAAKEALTRADLLCAQVRAACDAAAEALAGIACDTALLDEAAAIETLVGRAGAATQARRDIPKREAELLATEERITFLLRQLDIALPADRAADAIPREALVAEARRLFSAHEKLRADLDRLPADLAAAAREIEEAETALARLPAPIDGDALAHAVREARLDGDPSLRAREAAQALADATASLAAAQRRIPAWPEGGVALPVQPLAAYERLDTARAEAAAAVQVAAAEAGRLRDEQAADQAQLDRLAAAGMLPDDDAIAAARAWRQEGWHLVYRRAFTPDPPSPAEESAWAGESPLPLAYAQAVVAADALADQRNREAERVAQAADLAARRAARAARLTEAGRAHDAAVAALAATTDAWADALAPLGLGTATTLAELRALVAGRERVIDALRDRDAAAAAAAGLARRQDEAASRLAGALGRTDAAALPALLAAAEQVLEESRKTEQTRTRHRDRLDAQRRTGREAADALAAAERRAAALTDEWEILRASLRRPDGEPPALTVALLDQFAKLHAASVEAAQLRHRLHEMRADVAALAHDAALLAARIAPDIASAEGEALVADLARRLADQRARAAQRKTAQAQLDRARKSLVEQEARQAAARIELCARLAAIGADTVEAAAAVLARAEERARRAEAAEAAARQLAEAGDGRDLATLRGEVAVLATDAIQDDIAAAESGRAAAEDAAQALAGRIATLREALARDADDVAAMQAAADQQAAAATLARVADEALLLHVAGLLLEDALAAIDASGTSALLARIGARFRTLTGGAFERIEAHDDGDGTARLRAIPSDRPDEAKEIAHLSDGTRDQLFLALRLAAIEDHVATAPPLPFIGDDILQTFDDDRARAAMRALLDLSDRVQVILLSHHPHLRLLAEGLGAGRVCVCEIAAA